MVDDKVEDQPGKECSDPDLCRIDSHIEELTIKIDELELERDGLGNEFEWSQVAMKGAKAVMARKADLEAEVSRPHCDSISIKMIVVDAVNMTPQLSNTML
ncbi:hypothetical protein K1719_022194 [Acacia pycnantha]|nr:hypothetical protein K1719_022194 [Acacia pycnantha]